VRDGKDNPVMGAVVTLFNKETKQGQSLVTDKGGKFVFDDCKKNVDYELVAEYKKVKSPVRVVSSFNPSAKPFIELKLGEAKPPEQKK
jgi:hypothetical protein